MMKKYAALAFCTLAVTACSDRGEAERPFEQGQDQILGQNSSADGVIGQLPDDGVTDEIVATVVDMDADIANEGENVTADDTPVLPTENLPTENDATAEPSTPDDLQDDAVVTDAPVASPGGRVLLPPDCNVVIGDEGRSYCISESAGNRLFALNSDDTLRWTNILSDSGNMAEAVIIPGDELFVLRPDNNSSVTLTSLDTTGNTSYEALLTGDFNTVVEGIFNQPFLFLHVRNSAGDSSLLQLDAATGRQNRILNFTGLNVDSIAIEELTDNSLLAVTLSGVTNYLTLDELATFNRVFSLDPTNFQDTLPVHVANLRGQYLNQYVSLLRNAINLVGTDSDETEIACPGAGSINLLPQNSFISDVQFTRAYEFADCDISGTVANGSIVHTFSQLDTLNVRNASESLQMNNLSVARDTNGAEEGTVFVEERIINATLNNVYVFNGDNLTSERTLAVENYNHTFGEANVISIANADYARQITTQGDGVPESGFRLTESGSMQSVTNTDGTVDIAIVQPLVYLNSDDPTASATLDDAPLAGILELTASDTSTLTVDASRAGANQQNYLLTQRGTEITIDDVWMVQPVDQTLSILD